MEATVNVTNAKEAIVDFYRRHSHIVKGIKAYILTLTIKLEYNRIAEEDEIRKKLQKHPIGRRLLSTELAIPQTMEAINKQMTQLKKPLLILQSIVQPLKINN